MMFNVFLYHFISNISCTPCTKSSCPKMLSPVSFFQMGKFFLQQSWTLPFNCFRIKLSDNFGGYSICMWTWSLLTTPLSISISIDSQSCISKLRHLFCTSPVKTWYRYFVTQTICTVKRVNVWEPLLYFVIFFNSKFSGFHHNEFIALKCEVLNLFLWPINSLSESPHTTVRTGHVHGGS